MPVSGVAGPDQAGDAGRLHHLERQQHEHRPQERGRVDRLVAVELQRFEDVRQAEEPGRPADETHDDGDEDGLVGGVDGGAAVAGPEEAGHQGGGADADEDGAAAEEPGEVVGGGLGGLGGDLFGLADVLEAAGHEAVEEVDGEDEQLLQQHRPRQHQDEQPRRPSRVEQPGSGRQNGRRFVRLLRGTDADGGGVVHARIVHSPPPTTPKRSPARSLRPGCVAGSPLTVASPLRTDDLGVAAGAGGADRLEGVGQGDILAA